MASEATIGGNGQLFVGEDKTIQLEVLDLSGTPVDITGWPIILDVRKTDKTADPPIFSKTATIEGIYSATKAQNTQRAVIALSDDELNTVTGKTYRHSWKRTTAGLETILCRGNFIVEKATAP